MANILLKKKYVERDCSIMPIINKEPELLSSPLEVSFWYALSGGSLSVFPKSFVKFKEYLGFHLLSLTNFSIIVATGNMLRIYAYNHNMK